GRTVERFLEIPWPGVDEAWRADAIRLAEDLAKSLESDGKPDEAKAPRARLADAPSPDPYLRPTWEGGAWLGLVAGEPVGATASYGMPRTVFGGAIIKEGRGKHPESVYTCPKGFDGDYKVRVKAVYNDPKAPVKQATLEVFRHEGTPEEVKEVHTIDLT